MFNVHATNSYDLFILAGMDRFFYLIANEEKVVAFKTYHFPNHNYLQLKEALRRTFVEDHLLQNNYKNTCVGLIGHTYTLIPDKLYDPGQNDQYIIHSHSEQEKSVVLADALKGLKTRLVHRFHEEILDLLNNYFTEESCYSSMSALLALYQQCNAGMGKQVFMHMTGRELQIAVFEYQKLLFANTFHWRSPLDIAYYAILVFNQLNLNAGKTPVFYSGEFSSQPECEEVLRRYIKYVDRVPQPSFFEFGKAFEKVDTTTFFDMLGLKLLIE